MNLGFSGTFPPFTDGDSDYNMFLLNSLSNYEPECDITLIHNQKNVYLKMKNLKQIQLNNSFNYNIMNQLNEVDLYHLQIGGPLAGLFLYKLLKILYSKNNHPIICTLHPSHENLESRQKLIYETAIHLYRSIKMKDNIYNLVYCKDMLLMRDLLKSTDMLVMTSDYQKKILSNRYKNYKDKLYTIPLGIDIDYIQSVSIKNDRTLDRLKNKFNINEDSFVVISFGSITPGKGITEVIKSIYSLVNKYGFTNIKYLIVGNPYFIHYKIKLNYLINKLNLQNNVYLVGYLPFDDVIRLIKFSDIIIQPRKSKRMTEASLSLLIALCSQKPVIANGGGALNEYLIDNETGLLANYNSQDFIEKILYLYNNKSERVRISRNAIKWCKNNISPKIIAKKHTELYELMI